MSDIEKGELFNEERTSAPDGVLARDFQPEAQQNAKSSPAPPAAVDWDGSDDPANPHNWSLASRIYHATIPGLIAFSVTFGTSIYTPAIPDVIHDLHTTRTVALLGLSLYTLGLGFGPIVSAPLSERHGRKIVYLSTAPLFMLFTLGAGFSKTIAGLLVCRFFAGLTGSPALAVGAGSNADLFLTHQRAMATCLYLVAPFAGPSLGPVVGGFAAQHKGWKWTQCCIIFVGLTIWLLTLPTKETYKPVILKRRAKKRGIEPSKVDTGGRQAVLKSLVQNVLRPLHMLITEPVVLSLSLYTAFAFAVLFLFFAAFPIIFSAPPYSFTASQTGLTFLGIGLGVLLAGLTGVLIDHQIYQKQHRRAVAEGKRFVDPEYRLWSAMVGSVGIPVGLFWFGWAANDGRHWAVLVVAAVPFAWGNLCLFISAALYLIDVYGPLHGASSMAANGILRYTLGAVFPLFTVQMYRTLGIGWATSLLGFLSLLMLPIPWVLYKWGPQIRKRSRYPVLM